MVAISRLLNLTMVVPELDKLSFWEDPDIFYVNHFIDSLRDEVRIVKRLPKKLTQDNASSLSLPPVSWSNESYYLNQILPLFNRYKVIHFNKIDTWLANNGLSIELQKLRCRVNYHAWKFTEQIETLGSKVVQVLEQKGPFLALHLRYEMDMLAFSGCTHVCTEEETEELKKLRSLSNLTCFYRIGHFTVSIASDLSFQLLMETWQKLWKTTGGMVLSIYQKGIITEYDAGIELFAMHMLNRVWIKRRYLGYRKTVVLNHKNLVELLDMHQNKTIPWEEFVAAVQDMLKVRFGQPAPRTVFEDKLKEEEYFYSNPTECLE